jgi:hypothetical protein
LRAEDGLGPFCGTFERYLEIVAQHNAAIARRT